MNEQVKLKILEIVENAPGDEHGKYGASLGKLLIENGINYKELGYNKLRDLFEGIPELVYSAICVNDSGIPVGYVTYAGAENARPIQATKKVFKRDKSTLFDFAYVDRGKYADLANLALEEAWYFGEEPSEIRPYPILENYLKYTYFRLNKEGKIKSAQNDDGKKYAAFNTGLVDKKYEYIYAFFEENTRYSDQWYLKSFEVAAQDWGGKMIAKLFNPLPEKADYFEGKISNMLFDTSTGDLNVDSDHIICERIGRFPFEFIDENISKSLDTHINGLSLEEAYYCSDYRVREDYFIELGKRIKEDSRTLVRMKNRLEDSISFAKKRVEWNYKAAIPMYYPNSNKGSLLLPLSLVDDDKVDLALVVEKQQSGAYIGHTVLTLKMAYSNSRLVTRPDSDWLKTKAIADDDNDSFYDL